VHLGVEEEVSMGRFGSWLQIGANVGILGGLILVGLQIKQSSDLTQMDMVSRDYEYAMQFGLAMMGENPASDWTKAALQPDSLSDEELARLSFMIDFWWNFHDRIRYLEDHGLAKEDWATALAYHTNHTYGGSRPAAATFRYWMGSPNAGILRDWTDEVASNLPTKPAGNADFLKSIRAETHQAESQIARDVKVWFQNYANLWRNPTLRDVPEITDRFLLPLHVVDESGVHLITDRQALRDRYTKLLADPEASDYSGDELLASAYELYSDRSARVDADWMELDRNRNPKGCFGRSYTMIHDGDDWKISGFTARSCDSRHTS
jgi:hypothetical protein